MILILQKCKLKKLREARSFDATNRNSIEVKITDEKSAFTEILKEKKKVNLHLEGHRFIDLRLAAKVGVEMDRSKDDDNPGVDAVGLKNGSHMYTLPIPSAEIAGNKKINKIRVINILRSPKLGDFFKFLYLCFIKYYEVHFFCFNGGRFWNVPKYPIKSGCRQ